MATESLRSRIAPLVERLLDEPHPRRRERLLLWAAGRAAGAHSQALWRETGEGWIRVAAAGDQALLPRPGQVQAVARGILAPELPEGRVVVVSAAGPWRLALALGGLAPDDGEREASLDLIEALLLTLPQLDPGTGSVADCVLPPFPSGGRDSGPGVHRPDHSPAASELRLLMGHIRTTLEFLARDGARLSPAERARQDEYLERQCQRAGDLLIDSNDGEE